MFSFGRLVLFLLVPKETFVKWLFVPIKDEADLLSIQTKMSTGPQNCLKLVSKMTSLTERISVKSARVILNELRTESRIKPTDSLINDIDFHCFLNEITIQGQNYVDDLTEMRYLTYHLYERP